ncbi:MAG TPA: tetratricopeptide repeat protein [Terriglobales bacterium]|nr:tetratricopeptide repeat protein [Terriglobales bacterium]
MKQRAENEWRPQHCRKAARVAAVLGLAVVLAGLTGCTKLKARDQLNKGVQSYKNAKYEDAIAHFQKAVALDPRLLNARLYLATAYAQQYVPGADTSENNQMGQQAIDEYKRVLEMDPHNTNSVKGIASLYFNMKKFEQAKEYHEKAKQLDPNDPEEYYSIAVIDWTQSYAPRQEERAKLGLKPEEPFKDKDKKVCESLHDRSMPKVDEGIQNLTKALQLRPDYDDAMAYLNLLYREKADLECGNPDARAADLKVADDWVDKTMATKKQKAEKLAQKGGGIVTTEQPK